MMRVSDGRSCGTTYGSEFDGLLLGWRAGWQSEGSSSGEGWPFLAHPSGA
ncbi:MAG TPA: hypothetical protein VN666_19400 [Nitrospira sp.]|nr:hypothetical protein [Nitrospira sp.]